MAGLYQIQALLDEVTDKDERSALLIGAAMDELPHLSERGWEQELRVQRLRKRMGDTRFEELGARGQALDHEALIAIALGERDVPGS